MDGARFANAVASLGCAAADVTWRAGVDALSFGFTKNGAMNAEALILFDPALADEARIRRKRAGHLLSKGRFVAAQLLAMLEGGLWLANAAAANRAAQILARSAGARLMHPVQANELFVRLTAPEAASLRARGFDFYDWGRRRGASGDELASRGGRRRAAGRCDPDAMTSHPARSGVVAPFATVTLIWSSTWIVIRDSLGVVPPAWSVCYRFAMAAVGMAVLAKLSGASLRVAPRVVGFAALLGVCQFSLNFNLLYRAEAHLTSGLCALVYALLLIPNSLFARAVFGERVSRSFLIGSGIAVAGIGLLFLNEYRASSTAAPAEVLLGLGLCTTAVLFASVANVMQAARIARGVPMTSLLVWAMAIGAGVDALYAGITTGLPPFDPRPGYWFGHGLSGAGRIGDHLSALFPADPARRRGPGRLYEPADSDHRHGHLHGGRGLSLGTPLAVAGALLALGGMAVALHARFASRAG